MPHERDTPKGVSKPRGMPILSFLSRIPRDSLPNLNVHRYRGITRWDAEISSYGESSRERAEGDEKEREREEVPLVTATFYGRDACPASVIEDRRERETKNKERCSQGTFEYSDQRRKRDFCDAVRVNALSKT